MQTSRIYARCGVVRKFQSRSLSKSTAAPIPATGASSFAVSSYYASGAHDGRMHLCAHRGSSSAQLLVARHFSSWSGGGGGGDKKGLGRDSRFRDPNNTNKQNFARKFLEPAARGELGHKVHIPKLAGRRPKANLGFDNPKYGRRWTLGEDAEDVESAEELSSDDLRSPEAQSRQRDKVQTKDNQPVFDYKAFKEGKLPEFMVRAKNDPYFALDELWNDKKYFWNEEEHDNYIPKDLDLEKFFEEDGEANDEWTEDDLKPRPHRWIEDDIDPKKYFGIPDDIDLEAAINGTFDFDKYIREKEAETQGGNNTPEEKDRRESNFLRGNFEDEQARFERGGSTEPLSDPETRYFQDEMDIFEIAKRPIEDFADDDDPDVAAHEINRQQILPLQIPEIYGDGSVEDYIQALNEHPTDYARVTYIPLHPNERREPLPMFLPSFGLVKQPSLDFVEAHVRYLYVTNLPPLTVNGKVGDISNAVHCSSLEHQVAHLLDVDSTQVCAANSTSAFVGFHSPRDLANAIQAGPLERTLVNSPMAQQYDGSLFEDNRDSVRAFVDGAPSPDCIVCLTNLPLHCSVESLADELLPAKTELRLKYGELFPGNIMIPSEGNALVRFSSPETAASLLADSLFEARLEKMGVYKVHYLRARRELLHAGFHKMDKYEELREYGPRLVIDGLHTPSKDFWLSNASAVYVRDLDPNITEEQLTTIFQKYSKRLRFPSSIEFVRCELSGEPILGAAYVGFEEVDEARACRQSLGSEDVGSFVDEEPVFMKIGNRVASIFGMADREVPGFDVTPLVRSTRTAAELEDEMNNWQQYVDPADIEWLDKHGSPRVVIDEILRGIRRRNPYFGPFDSGFRDEQIEPDKKQGQLYRELVVELIDLLKKCTATRENPGPGFWEQVYPGEEPDYSIFDEWDKKKPEIDAAYLKYMNDRD